MRAHLNTFCSVPSSLPRPAGPSSRPAVRAVPFVGRVFGLKDFVAHTNCSSSNALVLNTSHDWPVYVSPGILLLLYYTVISLLKLRTHHPPGQVGAQGQRSSVSHLDTHPPSGHGSPAGSGD